MGDGDAATERWKAKWCWPRKHDPRPWNHYVYFRRAFELSCEPRVATVRVSADARYTLYVNGVRCHHGPARCFPQWQSSDTLDIAPNLVVGRNVVCAIVHQYGVPTFQSVFRDASGFLLDGVVECDDGSSVNLHTPGDWLCLDARAWRRDTERKSYQLGFQEHFDAGADPVDWMLATYDPAGDEEHFKWSAPSYVMPVGAHPWLNLEERGVPLLADHVQLFEKVLNTFTGATARGSRVADDVYHLAERERRSRENDLVRDADAMLHDDAATTTINPPDDDGHFVALLLDPGQYLTGHLILDIADAAGDEDIDVLYGEELDKHGFLRLFPDPQACKIATAARYRCRPGAQRWETFHFDGMRYVALVFRHLEKPLVIRHVAVRQVQASVEDVGAFECSDVRLNTVWHVARETQRNCLFDAFVDCPWREQAMWWGDARVQARVTAHAFGDWSIFERGIRLVARSQAADGSLHSHPPSDQPGHRLPDFMLTWVMSLWDWHEQTGRVELLRECLPTMHRLFEFFASHELRDALLDSFDGFWLFLDWQNLFKGNVSATFNMMYLDALRHAAKICRFAEDDASAQRYQAKAGVLASAIEQHFWDEQAARWRDGFDLAKNEPVEAVSQHANALAILLDLKPETHASIARDVVLKSARARKPDVLTGSPFFYAYVLEAMCKAGLREEAIDVIREKWGRMIDRGAATFWENWDDGVMSRCHAWSASPLYHLSQQVLGVQSVAPGWTQVEIRPLIAGLDYARGVIPTPMGKVRVDWERVDEDQLAVRVDLPGGMDGRFISPLGQEHDLRPGMQEFHT